MSHTLNVENWWLDSPHCCVHLQAVEGRSLSGVIKTPHHDLQLLPACRTRQLRLSEIPQLCLRSRSSGVLGERWLCSMIPSVPKSRLALSLLTRQATGKGHQRTAQTDIRTCLHCWGNSLVNVCGVALKKIANHSRGVLTEMRVARDRHTVCTSWTRGY